MHANARGALGLRRCPLPHLSCGLVFGTAPHSGIATFTHSLATPHLAASLPFSQDGGSPLYFAAEKGNVEAVRELLKCGAEVDKFNVHRATALHAASANGHAAVVSLLLAAGANIEQNKQVLCCAGWAD